MYQTEIYIAPTRQGTINIILGSTTVTGNDTDFNSSDIGKQLKIRTEDGYKTYGITAVASSTSITISAASDYGQSNCYYNTDYKLLDTSPDISMPVTYSIFDISEPDKRGGTRSKTLELPGTKQNNIIFNHIFEIDSDGTFNPNISADCIVYQNTVEILTGSFQLLQVNRNFDNIIYECAVLGRVTNIYTVFGEKNLNDLDLSDYNHNYTQANLTASWTLDSDNGYVYPMIDYGETDASQQTIWQVNQLYPAVYVKTLIDKIFALAGFTYSSTFFNSGFFKKLIVPFNAGSFKYSEDEVASRLFEAGMIAGSASITTSSSDTYLTIPYNDIAVIPDMDPSGQFNPATHEWTVAKSGHYDLTMLTNLTVTFYNTSGLILDVDYPGYIEVVITRGGTPLAMDPTMQDDISSYLHFSGSTTPHDVNITSVFNNLYLLVGDVVSFQVHLRGDTSFTTFGVTVEAIPNCYVYNAVVNENITEGDGVVMSDVIPQNIRISDFFRSITNMFNLYIDEDINIPNRLNIEPRNTFYGGGILQDWTHKWDRSQPVNILLMGELTSQNYLFTYRSDQDYWNDKYTKKYIQKDHNEIYGEYWLPVDNDFLTDTQNIDVVFAPTVLSQYQANSMILSSIRFIDTNPSISTDKTSPKGSVIRILYYGGLKSGNWTYRSLASGTAVDTSKTQYPYAGHFDDPVNPTVDINFGLPAELYYQAKGQSVTDNNLFNAYYSSQYDEITDKDSKVVDMFLNLNPADIQSLDFRNEIYIAGQYYRLVEVTDYDIVNAGLTKCRFLKVKTGRQFVASTHNLNGGKGALINNMRVPVLSYLSIGIPSGLVVGNNNTTKKGGLVITGDGNAVSGKNVTVLGGNGNIINANNVTLINTSGQTITDDNATYIDGARYVKASDMSGQSTLMGGMSTVSLTGISPASVILISYTGIGILTGTLSVAADPDYFTINSTSPTDTAVVNWYVAKM